MQPLDLIVTQLNLYPMSLKLFLIFSPHVQLCVQTKLFPPGYPVSAIKQMSN
jgi:hypothetical protein